MIHRIRFKTEEEMQRDYGDIWKKECWWNLSGQMNYLFGNDITIGFKSLKQDSAGQIGIYQGWMVRDKAVIITPARINSKIKVL